MKERKGAPCCAHCQSKVPLTLAPIVVRGQLVCSIGCGRAVSARALAEEGDAHGVLTLLFGGQD